MHYEGIVNRANTSNITDSLLELHKGKAVQILLISYHISNSTKIKNQLHRITIIHLQELYSP